MHMLVTGGAGFVGSRLLLLVGFLMLAVVRKPVFWI
jgi:dTDP-D-glucose 4,6-dehydratase